MLNEDISYLFQYKFRTLQRYKKYSALFYKSNHEIFHLRTIKNDIDGSESFYEELSFWWYHTIEMSFIISAKNQQKCLHR